MKIDIKGIIIGVFANIVSHNLFLVLAPRKILVI